MVGFDVVFRFLTSKLGLGLIGGTVVLIAIGLHLAGDASMKHQRDTWKVTAESWKASSVAYERGYRAVVALRASEWASAKNAVSEADALCQAKVERARKSAQAIRVLLDRPVKIDPITSCPVPTAITASDLRGVLGL